MYWGFDNWKRRWNFDMISRPRNMTICIVFKIIIKAIGSGHTTRGSDFDFISD